MTDFLKKLITTSILALVFLTADLFAETDRESVFSKYPSSLGYNFVSNETEQLVEGLFYRHQFGNFGLNVAFNLNTNNEYRNIFELVAGGEHRIAESSFRLKNEKIDDYIDSMIFFWYEGGYRTVRILKDSGYPDNTSSGFVAGAGFGLEVVMMNHLSALAKVGYRAIFPENTQLAFTTCTGFQYRF